MSDEKEERTEYVSMYVTPRTKSEFELANNNKTLQDDIIRRFIKGESLQIEDELRELDEADIKYRAKLLALKDRYSESVDLHLKKVNEIYEKGQKEMSKINKMVDLIDSKSQSAISDLKRLCSQFKHIPVNQINDLMDALDRFEKMSPKQKELIELMIRKD